MCLGPGTRGQLSLHQTSTPCLWDACATPAPGWCIFLVLGAVHLVLPVQLGQRVLCAVFVANVSVWSTCAAYHIVHLLRLRHWRRHVSVRCACPLTLLKSGQGCPSGNLGPVRCQNKCFNVRLGNSGLRPSLSGFAPAHHTCPRLQRRRILQSLLGVVRFVACATLSFAWGCNLIMVAHTTIPRLVGCCHCHAFSPSSAYSKCPGSRRWSARLVAVPAG